MQFEPIEVTIKVTSVLERLGVPYLIGGSLASTLYGMVRTTQVSDIIADMRPQHSKLFVEALQGEFFIDEEMIAEFHSKLLQLQHHSSRCCVQSGCLHPALECFPAIPTRPRPETNLQP